MILDLPLEDIFNGVKTYKGLLDKIKEGIELLKDEN